MRKFVYLGIFLILLAPLRAQCNETDDYMVHLRQVAEHILHEKYELLGGTKTDGTPVAGICDSGCSSLIGSIETNQFMFIAPLIYTNSASDFAKILNSSTNCRNLGVLSYVESIAGPGSSFDEQNLDFFRPTDGFAIYKLPAPNDKILLLRAEDYIDSGRPAADRSSIDIDVKVSDFLRKSIVVSLPSQQGRFIEVSADNCRPINGGTLIEKSIGYAKGGLAFYYRDSWLSNPIIYGQKIYFLDASVSYPIPNTPQNFTEYDLTLQQVAEPFQPYPFYSR